MFKGLNYGQVVSRKRLERILHHLQSSTTDETILEFINTVNVQFKESVVAGYVLVADELMVKSFHKKLKGKMKIKRKPRPVGNEFKNVCDGQSKIVLHIELYEGKEYM